MPPSGRRQHRLFGHLLVRLALALGSSALFSVLLSGGFGVAPWLSGLVGVGLFLAIYGGSLLAVRNALVSLDATAAGLPTDEPGAAPHPVGIGEVDSLAHSLHQASLHFHDTQQALRREQDLLEVVLEALPGGVLLVNHDDRVAYSNSACREMLGMVGDPSGRLGLRPIQRLVRRVRYSDEAYEETMTRGYPERTLGVRAFSIDEGGRVLVIVLDLTETMRIQTMRRDFVTDASHELKTPVASILASVEALGMALDRDRDSARLFAGQISAAALRLSRLITDLLDLSRLEAQQPTAEQFDLEEVILVEVEPFVKSARQKGIDFTVRTHPVDVSGSAAELGLAIRNLCDNALRYTEEGGRIQVTLERLDGDGVVVVTDTGMGIPGRDLGRIFERFYRVDVARSRQTGGTGLGLAIVKHVAERHRGKVTVKSLLGEGSTFTLRVPSVGGGAPSS